MRVLEIHHGSNKSGRETYTQPTKVAHHLPLDCELMIISVDMMTMKYPDEYGNTPMTMKYPND